MRGLAKHRTRKLDFSKVSMSRKCLTMTFCMVRSPYIYFYFYKIKAVISKVITIVLYLKTGPKIFVFIPGC